MPKGVGSEYAIWIALDPGASGHGFRVVNYTEPKPMKRYRITPGIAVVTTFCVAVFALSFNASATLLNIGDVHELGSIPLSIQQGDTAITKYVNALIELSTLGGSGHVIIGSHDNLVTRSMNNFGTLPGPATLMLKGKGNTVNVGDASYLLAHYGSSSGGFSEVWVIHDFALTTIPNTENGHRLCSWALFGPAQAIPDGSTTIGLFSSALATLGMLRCFRRS